MRFCELQQKEVINVTDCKCLGNVGDLEFDECNGCIRALIVPGPGKWLGCVCREFEIFPLKDDHGSIYRLESSIHGRKVAVYTAHLDYLDRKSVV